MKKKDRSKNLICVVGYAAGSAIVSWLFYDSFIPVIVMAPFYSVFLKTVRNNRKRSEAEEFTEGFLRALQNVSSSIASGISAENAFVLAEHDMEKMYSADAQVTKELALINSRTRTGMRISDAVSAFANRVKIREITDFAEVFAVASQKGADFPKILSSCTQIIENRRRAEREAEVLIRAKVYEQRVMCVIPLGILLYLRASSNGFIEVLYHNTFGVIIMTACLLAYVTAVRLSQKIADISEAGI